MAKASAAALGLAITIVKSQCEDFDFGKDRWDLVLFSYAWVPLTDAGLVAGVHRSLERGGVVVIEHPVDDPRKPEKPVDAVNSLATAWAAGFRILRYEDTEDMCDWRNRKARLMRLLARKWTTS